MPKKMTQPKVTVRKTERPKPVLTGRVGTPRVKR